MEPKKNPKVDIHTKRGVIFNLSLVLSIAVVICAFKWVVPLENPTVSPSSKEDLTYIDLVPVTFIETKAVEAPKPVITKPVTLVNAVLQEIPDTDVGADSSEPVDIEILDLPAIQVSMTPEVDTTEFIVVETPPEPVGGMSGFYKTLRDNLKYPKSAVRYRTEGKVLVRFTIEPTGELSNIKVLKGIGNGCDEEAVRVVGLSQWKAGKQRGKPVRVKMIMPVIFQLKERD